MLFRVGTVVGKLIATPALLLSGERSMIYGHLVRCSSFHFYVSIITRYPLSAILCPKVPSTVGRFNSFRIPFSKPTVTPMCISTSSVFPTPRRWHCHRSRPSLRETVARPLSLRREKERAGSCTAVRLWSTPLKPVGDRSGGKEPTRECVQEGRPDRWEGSPHRCAVRRFSGPG